MALYYCTRQRAGPLVKESRALRPRLSKDDAAWERREKQQIIKSCQSAFSRSSVDRLELRLALFGYAGNFYTLTFDNAHLPDDFPGVRRCVRSFMGRARRWKQGNPFDWAYCIEGKHGDQRWHIHMILRNSDFSPAEVRHLWKNGFSEDEPLLKRDGGFRRLAEYLNKERAGGHIPLGRHPWSVSRSLSHQLPPVERWRDEAGEISIPKNVLWSRHSVTENDFGVFRWASWIALPENPVFLPKT